jgi:hypothetical protein
LNDRATDLRPSGTKEDNGNVGCTKTVAVHDEPRNKSLHGPDPIGFGVGLAAADSACRINRCSGWCGRTEGSVWLQDTSLISVIVRGPIRRGEDGPYPVDVVTYDLELNRFARLDVQRIDWLRRVSS